VIGLRSRRLAVVLAAVWALLIWLLMTRARVSFDVRTWWMPWLRNLLHAPLFGTLAVLVALAWRPGAVPGPGADGSPTRDGRAGRRAYWIAVACAVGYGALIEWRQAHLPGRVASGYDVLTDAIGALGVPWAMATGALFPGRALLVLLAAVISAAGATWL
jgi:hypothetical protein